MKRHNRQLVVVALSIAWALMTVLQQFPRMRPVVRIFDPLSTFTPVWTFFAPRPANSDFYLLKREKDDDDTETVWTSAVQYQGFRWWHCLYNPGQRAEKALFDTCQELLITAQLGTSLSTLQSVPSYLAVLNLVSNHLSYTRGTTQIQFMIVLDPGHSSDDVKPRVLFTSQWHRRDCDAP
ncbi:hypothetical protein D9V34_03480 [Mycetocola lacteus]|uniref:Uncharacterized protein n=1 Tax=Mycetocola lacteus TaxID=76637 RepID=A0A3L7AWG9_9MICO|nr:hypothetical protein [Mycetocola lacteus]RLP83880.1 hypothetical protein D9V34_03480 [Mycetocola lacteus]